MSLALVALCALELLQATEQRRLALASEERGDSKGALVAWYRLLDSTRASDDERHEAMKHVHDLLPKVPVDDSVKPSVWKVRVLIFHKSEFSDVSAELTDVGKADIKAGFAAFQEHVYEATRHCLRITADFEDVDDPVVRFSGDKAYFANPWDLPYDLDRADFVKERYDSVFAYVLMGDDKKAIPAQMFGGTYGADITGTHGAGYSAITYRAGDLAGRTGEVELHEWLHQVDWMFFHVQGYPDAFFPSPDEGRTVDDAREGGDPCAPRRKKDETDWFPFLDHLLRDHATDEMWRSASMRRVTRNCWNAGDVREWRIAGPFTWDGEPGAGLDAKVAFHSKDATPARASGDRRLHLEQVFEQTDGHFVAIAEAWAFVPEATDVVLHLGSDDGCRVSVNGVRVFETTTPRAVEVDQDEAKAHFRAGWNRIRFKVENVGGPWGLFLRIAGEDDVAPRGLRLHAEAPLMRVF